MTKKFNPLISIIIPLSDSDDGMERIASAESQSWENKETLTVSSQDAGGRDKIIHACNVGIAQSQGQYMCLMLPGSRFRANKIEQQAEFLKWFETFDAIIYSDYSQTSHDRQKTTSVTMGNISPEAMPCYLYGIPDLNPSTLLFPANALEELRSAFGNYFREDLSLNSAILEACLFLCRKFNFIWQAKDLIETHEKQTVLISGNQDFYKEKLPELLQYYKNHVRGRYGKASLLGEFFAARLKQHLYHAAKDVLVQFLRERRKPDHDKPSIKDFLRPTIKSIWQRLPERLKKLIKSRCGKINHDAVYRLDFKTIYEQNGFVGTESLSGLGSTMFQTRIVRRELPLLLRRHEIQSILDVPCGDFHWMNLVDFEGIRYVGGDVVADLVKMNQRRYGNQSHTFLEVDLIKGPLPESELVFCRDCLVHLPYADVFSALSTIIKSKAEWLLVTTFPGLLQNNDLDDSGWRALNMELPPFNFPPPVELLYEKSTEAGGRFGDKALGLWRVDSLNKCGQEI
ncbi:MAG: class I SAM-dependent methyltransferase [Victivallales bacterium]|nr:class I SAM-dependent methyltransferase [Victivallales bacterium]